MNDTVRWKYENPVSWHQGGILKEERWILQQICNWAKLKLKQT